MTLPWPDDADEKDRLWNSSLGPDIIAWAEGATEVPDLIDHMTGKPWRFTDGQVRFLVLWYHVGPDGRFTYRSGVKRGAKGTGERRPGGGDLQRGVSRSG